MNNETLGRLFNYMELFLMEGTEIRPNIILFRLGKELNSLKLLKSACKKP